jgi:hypothetical protein
MRDPPSARAVFTVQDRLQHGPYILRLAGGPADLVERPGGRVAGVAMAVADGADQ